MRLSSIFPISERQVSFLAILTFFVYAAYRVLLIKLPHPDAGGVENNVIWFIQRLLDGGNLYSDPGSSPYAVAQYTPLYYYLCAAVARVANAGPDDVVRLFEISRAVSLFLNFLFCFFVFLTVNVFSRQRASALIAGVFAFIFLEITSFSRPDSLHHLFFIASFFCFAKFLQAKESGKRSNILFAASALLATSDLFAKQSAIALLIAYCCWFILQRKFRQFALWLIIYFITFGIYLFIVSRESGLLPFFANTIDGVNNGVSVFWYFKTIVKEFYGYFGLLWMPALFFILLTLRKEKNDLPRFLLITIIILFSVSNVFALKWGSVPGYFTEWVALVFIGCAVYGGRLALLLQDGYRMLIPSVLMLVMIVKLALITYPIRDLLDPVKRAEGRKQYQNEMEIATTVKQLLKNGQGHRVFNNIYSPELYLNNLLFRECDMPQFEVVVFGTWEHSGINYDRFRKELNDGSIQFIINKEGRSLQFMDIPLTMYQFRDSLLNGYLLYQYKSGQ